MREEKRIVEVKVVRLRDDDGPDGHGHGHGTFAALGIQARAEVVLAGIVQQLASGGLWGIAADSDADYLAEVEREELGELEKVLYAAGFRKRAINQAMREREKERG